MPGECERGAIGDIVGPLHAGRTPLEQTRAPVDRFGAFVGGVRETNLEDL